MNVDLVPKVMANSWTIELFKWSAQEALKRPLIADNVIVATGSRPEFSGSSRPRLVNSEELLRMTTLPDHLAIIGAGYIGSEFASIYRTLGCKVTLIERKRRVLPGWETEAGERVAEALEMNK